MNAYRLHALMYEDTQDQQPTAFDMRNSVMNESDSTT
jgi:hypothetical protein